MMIFVHLISIFTMLSLLSVGGGIAILPVLQHIAITQQHWVTADQFRDMYGLGQISPGPNFLMVLLIGDHVAGLWGALAVGFAFFVPASILVFGAHRLWQHFVFSPWRLSVQQGFAPIVVGLMLAGVYMLGRIAITDKLTFLLAIAAIGILTWRRINPAIVILLGGIIGMFIF